MTIDNIYIQMLNIAIVGWFNWIDFQPQINKNMEINPYLYLFICVTRVRDVDPTHFAALTASRNQLQLFSKHLTPQTALWAALAVICALISEIIHRSSFIYLSIYSFIDYNNYITLHYELLIKTVDQCIRINIRNFVVDADSKNNFTICGFGCGYPEQLYH